MEEIKINNELAVIEILERLMNKGYTRGIAEKDYYEIINDFVNRLQGMGFQEIQNKKFVVSNVNFSELSNNMKYHNGRYINDIEYSEQINKILPTYNYKPLLDRHFWFSECENLVLNQIIDEYILKQEYLTNINLENCHMAQKASAYLMWELTERYMYFACYHYLWPVKCMDIEEDIFNTDIAKYIKQPITKETLKNFYNHCVKEISCILTENDSVNRQTIISNDPDNYLSYQFYLRLTREYNFYRHVDYLKYSLNNYNNKKLNILFVDQKVVCETEELVIDDDFNEDIKKEYKQIEITNEKFLKIRSKVEKNSI